MIARYHRLVPDEVAAIQDHYEQRAGEKVSGDFYEELAGMIRIAAADPARFHPYNQRLRRANLKRFPFHFLFEIRPGYIYVTVVRHHKRHPNYGLNRR